MRGTQLELDCRPFLIAGFNVDNVAQAPVARTGRRVLPGEPNGRCTQRSDPLQLLPTCLAAAGVGPRQPA